MRSIGEAGNGVGANDEVEAMIIPPSQSADDDDEFEDRKRGQVADRGAVYRDYSIASEEEDLDAENRFQDNSRCGDTNVNRDDEDDDNTSLTSAHCRACSATELVNNHRGISLRKDERMLRTVASRVGAALERRRRQST